MADQSEIRFVLEKTDLPAAQSTAQQLELNFQIQPSPQFLDPFTAALIAGGALLIAKFVREQIQIHKGGLFIDLSHKPIQVRRDKEIPYGLVVIVDATGKKVKVETHDAPKDAAERLLGGLFSGALKSADQVSAAAKTALGAKNVS